MAERLRMKPQGRYGERIERVAGGYHLIRAKELCFAWWLLREKRIRLVELRTWLACKERSAQLDARCLATGAKASTVKELSTRELARTVGSANLVALKRSLRRLSAAGLLKSLSFAEATVQFAFASKECTPEEGLGQLSEPSFDEWLGASIPNYDRVIPVPCRLLRLLAGGAGRALIATTLGHMLRGLFWRRTGITQRGCVKTRWIAETFGIHPRRVKEARAHLVAIGWLEPQETHQRVMNARGRWFSINLQWDPAADREQPEGTTQEDPQCAVGEGRGGCESAPPKAPIGTVLAPPRNRDPSPTEKIQTPEPGAAPGPPAGVCTTTSMEEPECPPRWSNIVRADLEDERRTEALLADAVARGVIGRSEAERLNFFGAAHHARLVGTQNPPGLLRHIVEGRRWHLVTQADEEAARVSLRRLRGEERTEVTDGPTSRPPKPAVLSQDARFVRTFRQLVRRNRLRGEPLDLLNRELTRRGEEPWELSRWELAWTEVRGETAPKLARDHQVINVGELMCIGA